MTRLLAVLLILVSQLSASARFDAIPESTLVERLQSAPDKNSDRQLALEKMFADVGCKTVEQPLGKGKPANVICTLAGTTDDVIIVGAHLDHVSLGKGIVDDWTGAALLPTLYESLKALPRRHTFVFVGFTEEEKGLVGSAYYVKQMTSVDRVRAKAMINLECLGMTNTEIWESHTDKPLIPLLLFVSNAMKIPLTAVNVEKIGTADSESFAAAKIPRTTIHTVTQANLHVLHTTADNMKAINADQYYENYRFIAGFLAVLDDAMDKLAATQTKGN